MFALPLSQVRGGGRKRGFRFLVSGRPFGEPVARYGPIVMNADEGLRTVFEEYRNGMFIRYHGPGY
jgi:redox-sensitive bicupin YhaK (pirin superfamily)